MVSADGVTQVPFGSLATPMLLDRPAFSSAKANPTQPREPVVAMPSMIALSLALAR